VAGYSPQHPFRSHGPPFAMETSRYPSVLLADL
jgi:hypothetical protein